MCLISFWPLAYAIRKERLPCLHLHNSSRLFIFFKLCAKRDLPMIDWPKRRHGISLIPTYILDGSWNWSSRKASHKNISPNNKKWNEERKNSAEITKRCRSCVIRRVFSSVPLCFVLFRLRGSCCMWHVCLHSTGIYVCVYSVVRTTYYIALEEPRVWRTLTQNNFVSSCLPWE